MAARLKVWLVCAALVVFYLSLINFLLLFVSWTAPVSLFVTVPLGALAVVYLVYVFLVPALLGQPDAKHARVLTGFVMATGRCGGRFGGVSLAGPVIRVTVHSDGLRLRPLGRGNYTIQAREMSSITEAGSSLGRKVIIVHNAPGKASPVVLATQDADLRAAIMGIKRSPAVAETEPPVPETPEGKTARSLASNVVSLIYLAGLVTFLVIFLFAVTGLLRRYWGDVATFVIILVGLCGTGVFAAALGTNENRD